ncbi:DNA internalization-related competence protein ComEC/Rec2 [Desulforhopalus singaporensis]|uniref:Competence protein ComEC n=1 Tax=Desulforhopalus singaporensis TaxID=91360 RepID=A0A1H0U7F3_9BACT|nr:DNA internalization-related competence protein ComEC/Rec2 [Desulforhopalus singaporensis]SDP62091.1 competence protein ComEC [Desulforhopalus singaporensis]
MNLLAQRINDHLLVAVTISFLTGICISASLQLPQLPVAVLVFFIFTLAFILFILLPRQPNSYYCILLIGVSAAGWTHGAGHLVPPAEIDHVYNRVTTPQEAVLIGVISEMPTYNGHLGKYVINAEHLRFMDSAGFLSTRGKVLIGTKDRPSPLLMPGDKIIVRTLLKRPVPNCTPGTFDYQRYLAEKEIWVTGFLRSPALIKKLYFHPDVFHTLYYLPEKIRTAVGQNIDRSLSPSHAAIYRALLVGDRSVIADNTLESFKVSGTMHILAISGIHMTLVGTMLYAVFYFFLSRSEQLLLHYPVPKIAAFISMPFLFCYALLAGMNSPVFRALVMSCMVILALCLRRPGTFGSLLAATALLIAALDPAQIFTISFQLSFVAVTSIFLAIGQIRAFLPPTGQPASQTTVRSWITRLVRWITIGVLVSLSATLATAPILINSFSRVSVVGPIANLIVEPLLCFWTLPLGILSLPATVVSPELSNFLLSLGASSLPAVMSTIDFFSSFTCSALWLPNLPWWLIGGYYALLLWLLCCRKTFFLPAITVFGGFCGYILLFHQFSPPPPSPQNMRITFLDIGQGSATLVEFDSGEKIIVDGGGYSFGSSDVGKRTIAPYLFWRLIDSVDGLVITHPDADHYNGLDIIVDRFKPQFIWVRSLGGDYDNPAYRQLLVKAKNNNVQLTAPRAGERIVFGKAATNKLECVENFTSDSFLQPAGHGSRMHKNSGLVVRVCIDKRCVLLPGDIGIAGEQFLIDSNKDMASTVLLAAHHGSVTSNSQQFIDGVDPEIVIVSAGNNSRNHFPHPSLIQKCRNRGIDLFTTDKNGTLELILSPAGPAVYNYQRQENNPFFPLKKKKLEQNALAAPAP